MEDSSLRDNEMEDSSLEDNEMEDSSLEDNEMEDSSLGNDESEDSSLGDNESENSSLGDDESEDSSRRSSFKPIVFGAESEFVEFNSDSFSESESLKTDEEKINISQGFKTAEFFPEDSLLTNAEDFAQSIREGANLYKKELLKKIERQATDTERIHKKIISEKEEAEQEREKLLSSTEEKVKEIKKEAFQEGYDDGYKVGMQKRYDEAEPLAIKANSIFKNLSSLREVVRFQSEKELVKLALQIAKNVVAEEIKLNSSVTENIVKVALQETEKQGKIYLYLNQFDYEFLINSKCNLDSYLSNEQSLVIKQKSELSPGSIFVESEGEIISRSIEGQFEKIEKVLNEQIEQQAAQSKGCETDSQNKQLKSSPELEIVGSKNNITSESHESGGDSLSVEKDEKEDFTKDNLEISTSPDESDISDLEEQNDLKKTKDELEFNKVSKDDELSEMIVDEKQEGISVNISG